jgi:glycosyltransferase involved in cell wall biosynthesis
MESVSTLDVSAVVCTKNSISGIEQSLQSLRQAEVGQIIVVDANSTDGTADIARALADLVLTDTGTGLGNARNIGIARSTGAYVLNMGSDNVLPPGELEKMIGYLTNGNFQGVSAQTRVLGDSYVARGLNVWRSGKFPSGPRPVIGTPTLFVGDLLRTHPYDSTRRFSDDSELCERWAVEFGAHFAISDAVCFEVGKVSWKEVEIRATMYGESDHEVFTHGRESQGWGLTRSLRSVLHPVKSDFIEPLTSDQTVVEKVNAIPFLTVFTSLRYLGWVQQMWAKNGD